MNAFDKLTNFIRKKQPTVNVVLMVPKEIINNKKYNYVTMTTDALEILGCYNHGNNMIFKGMLKVDLEKK